MSLQSILSRVRSQTNIPLAVDFEVSTREQFDMVSDAGADAVFIGSELVSIIEESPKQKIQEAVGGFCGAICRKGGPARVRSSPPIPQPAPTPLPASKSLPNDMTKPTLSLPPRFGEFGGQYVPEILFECLASLESAYKAAIADPEFWKEFESHYGYMNRPSKLYYAERLTRETGGAGIWFKREDL
jgi:tryptophan synthase